MSDNIQDAEIVAEQTISPAPKKQPIKLDFPAAIREVINGKKITKLEWEDVNTYGILKDDRLKIVIKGKEFDWTVSEGDMVGIDWIVLSENN